MATLRRVSAGGFSIDRAVTVEELERMTENERLSLLIPTEKLFSSLPTVTLPEFCHRLCVNGCEIYQSKIHTSFAVGERVRMYSPQNQFFALGEVRDYDGKTAIKAIKFL